MKWKGVRNLDQPAGSLHHYRSPIIADLDGEAEAHLIPCSKRHREGPLDQFRRAACMGCHAGQRWQGLPSGCVACHAKDDAHKGSRGTNCAQCHTTAGWKQATFDHTSTGFPLIGGHAEASCAAATRSPRENQAR